MNLNHEVSLTQTGDTAWVTVGKILVRVMQTDEGAVCDMYDAALIEDDMSEAHMAACYTFFNDVGGDPSFSLDAAEALQEGGK